MWEAGSDSSWDMTHPPPQPQPWWLAHQSQGFGISQHFRSRRVSTIALSQSCLNFRSITKLDATWADILNISCAWDKILLSLIEQVSRRLSRYLSNISTRQLLGGHWSLSTVIMCKAAERLLSRKCQNDSPPPLRDLSSEWRHNSTTTGCLGWVITHIHTGTRITLTGLNELHHCPTARCWNLFLHILNYCL